MYYNERIVTPFEIICSFVERVTFEFDMVSIVLMTLKILGYFSGSWAVVFAPIFIHAALQACKSIIENCVRQKKINARKTMYRETYCERSKEIENEYEDGEAEE